jgi:hypothetical protein
MRVDQMGYVYPVTKRGKLAYYRVAMRVTPEARPKLPPPHKGKVELTRSLGTDNWAEANRLAIPIIAEFQALIDAAVNREFRGWISHQPGRTETVYSDDPRIPTWNAERRTRLKEELASLEVEGREPVTFEAVSDRWANRTKLVNANIIVVKTEGLTTILFIH